MCGTNPYKANCETGTRLRILHRERRSLAVWQRRNPAIPTRPVHRLAGRITVHRQGMDLPPRPAGRLVPFSMESRADGPGLFPQLVSGQAIDGIR